MTADGPGTERIRRHQWLAAVGSAVRTPRGATGLGLAGFVVAVAVARPAGGPPLADRAADLPVREAVRALSRSAPTSSAAMSCPGSWTAAGCCC